MELANQNNLSIRDFISSKTNIDGLIVCSKNDLDYLKIVIDLSNQMRKNYKDLNSFLNSNSIDDKFCFINMDSKLNINKDESVKLF